MKIATQNRLGPLAEVPVANDVSDAPYIIAAATITTSRFGPSGSSKKKNIALEQRMAVIPRIISDVFFELKSI